MKFKFSIFFALFTFFTAHSQFSRIHYIPPITSATNSGMAPGEQYLYLSTPNTTAVTATITPIGGVPFNVTLTNATPIEYAINTTTSGTTGRDSQLFTPNTTIGKLSNKGYLIEATDLIYANVRVTSNNGSQAGGLVAKGTSAMGKTFRIGGMLNKWNPLNNNHNSLLNFASIMATENNTLVTITLSDPLAIGTPMTNGVIYTGPITVTLNKNESYVFSFENTPTLFRSSYMHGGLIESDKNVVVNSGSFGGNSYTPGVTGDNSTGDYRGKDYGFDQIVPLEKTGKEYIFVKGLGSNALERVMVIAHTNGTQIFKNGSATPSATLNAGQYFVYDGSDFVNGNLYVTSTENVFCYQAVGGNTDLGNQNMFFVPPINCSTPSVVDNIPLIQKIGSQTFSGNVNIVTVAGSVVRVNNVTVTATPVPVIGPTTTSFVRYTLTGRTGNIKVSSTNQVYVSYFGNDSNATYGSYYSGFDTKPVINYSYSTTSTATCIPNIILSLTPIALTDSYAWYFNGSTTPIPGQTSNSYTPTQPGYYQATRQNAAGCAAISSDLIPVSECPSNIDNDLATDNLDIDDDNDGITNCTESYGNQSVNTSNIAAGTLSVGSYNNSFTGAVTTSALASPTPLVGNSDGSFITSIPAGNANWVTYKMNFAQPVSLNLEYIATAAASDLVNSKSEYIVTSDTNKNITVLNPTNQLLIDTNYDGVFESGVTEFTSFDIRFRLNNVAPLAAGTGTFKFLTYLTNTFSITHKNLSSIDPNKSSFKLIATCVPKDSDSDGIPDYLDFDSDNDGITDNIEAQGFNFIPYTNVDVNKDGLADVYGTGILPINTDTDSSASTGAIYDYIDLDSDNDGIYDLVESGSLAPDADQNGIIDGAAAAFGANGLYNALETAPDSGVLNYTIADTDADGRKNYIELDSDNDGCNDVIEAGFNDPNADGYLGGLPLTVNLNGVVTSGTNGYTTPNNAYITFASIVINTQPFINTNCAAQTATVSLVDNGGNSYQWQFSNDGINWTTLTNNSTYSGVTTNTLLITGATPLMSGSLYRVLLTNPNNICGLISSTATLTFATAPTANVSYAGSPYCPNLTSAQPVTLTGTGAYTGGTFSSTTGLSIDATTGAITPSLSVSGNYVVTYMVPASGGCSAFPVTGNVEIRTTSTATISYPSSPFCNTLTSGQAITLSGTGAYTGGSFSSTIGLTVDATTGAVTPSSSSPGNYIVTYSFSAPGCTTLTTTASVTITAVPTATISYPSSPYCSTLTTNQAVTLGGTNAYTGGSFSSTTGLVIDPVSGAINPSTSTAGNYQVTYTIAPAAGCAQVQTTAPITITQLPTVSINYAGSPYCDSVSTSQLVSITGTSAYTGGNFSSTAGLVINSSTGAILPNASTPGNYSVTYLLAAANGCASVNTSANLIITAIPTATVSYPSSPYCSTLTTNQAVTLGGTNAYTGGSFSSTSGLVIDPVSGAINPSTSTAGNYQVTYTIAPAAGCAQVQASAPLTITQLPSVSINYAGNPFCDSVSTSQLVTINGTASYTGGVYSSTSGLQVNSSTGAVSPISSTPGNYQVTYTLAAAYGCPQVSTNANVDINESPAATATPSSSTICSTETTNIQLTSSLPSTTYSWLSASTNVTGATSASGAVIADALTTSTTSAGNVVYTVTPFASGCAGVPINVQVNVNSLPRPYISDGAICVNETTNVTFKNFTLESQLSNSTHTFEWYYNSVLIPGALNSTYEASQAGTYDLIATNTITGCRSALTTATVTPSFPGLSIETDQNLIFSDSNTIEVTVIGGNGSYLYSIDDGPWQTSNIFTNFNNDILHTVKVIDTNGCTDLSEEVRVITYPTFFTPNGDGFHDTWNIIGLGDSAKIFIFDRYGKLLKQISSNSEGWDGTYIGKPVFSSDYWFTLEYEDFNNPGTFKTFKSHFSLKR
jgi:gliding motility-associated-like protein